MDISNLDSQSQLITSIGKEILGLISESWTEIHAEFTYEYGEGTQSVKPKIIYKNSQGEDKNPLSMSNFRQLIPHLNGLRDEINKLNKGKLTKFIMDIDSTLKFQVNFEYDDAISTTETPSN